ncbi:MAG: hypothetical protein H7Y22_09105 [Gemmatimonadaceae bacterium]|nr:hypothetical protein [Gloeobacterales cyanobacterium ES-bin-141]
MTDSVRTFVRKYRFAPAPLPMLEAAIEQGILPEDTVEADLLKHATGLESLTHFDCFNCVAEALLHGVTLSGREVHSLLGGSIHAALHQDARFYDTADGHWYLSDQFLCNDEIYTCFDGQTECWLPLQELLNGRLKDGLRPAFWSADERFIRSGEQIALNSLALAGFQLEEAGHWSSTDVQNPELPRPVEGFPCAVESPGLVEALPIDPRVDELLVQLAKLRQLRSSLML